MGRLTQYFAYLNAKKHPTSDELKFKYTHLTITEALKKVRRKFIRNG